MAEHKRHRHKKQGGKSFRILPVIFCAGTVLITLALIAAAPDTIRSAAGIAFSDAKKDYSTTYENIYVPLEDGETAETITNENGKPEIDPDYVEYPAYGVCFGQLSVKDCGVDCPLFMGDGDIALNNGAAVSLGAAATTAVWIFAAFFFIMAFVMFALYSKFIRRVVSTD